VISLLEEERKCLVRSAAAKKHAARKWMNWSLRPGGHSSSAGCRVCSLSLEDEWAYEEEVEKAEEQWVIAREDYITADDYSERCTFEL
jgi:hypothetical protein